MPDIRRKFLGGKNLYLAMKKKEKKIGKKERKKITKNKYTNVQPMKNFMIFPKQWFLTIIDNSQVSSSHFSFFFFLPSMHLAICSVSYKKQFLSIFLVLFSFSFYFILFVKINSNKENKLEFFIRFPLSHCSSFLVKDLFSQWLPYKTCCLPHLENLHC